MSIENLPLSALGSADEQDRWATTFFDRYQRILAHLVAQKKGVDAAIRRIESKIEAAKEILAEGRIPPAPPEMMRKGRRPKNGVLRTLRRTNGSWQNIREYPK